jgi:hypothetical protein
VLDPRLGRLGPLLKLLYARQLEDEQAKRGDGDESEDNQTNLRPANSAASDGGRSTRHFELL